MPKPTCLYGRTSTSKQETGLEAQLMACRSWCDKENIVDRIEFADDGVSGKEDSRPEFDRMLAMARAGELERIVIYSLSRLSRNVISSLMLVDEFNRLGVQLVSCTETIDVSNPEGKLFLAILAAFNQYMREDLVRKTKNGLERARRDGVKLGRKVTRDDSRILAELAKGYSPAAVAKILGISRGAVYRAIKAKYG